MGKQTHRSPCYGYNGNMIFHWKDEQGWGVGVKTIAKQLKLLSARPLRLFEVGDLPRTGTTWKLTAESTNAKLRGKQSNRGPVATIKSSQDSCPHSCGFHPTKWMKDGEQWPHKEAPVDWEAMEILDKACEKHDAFGYTHTRGDDALKSQKLSNMELNVSCDTAKEVKEYLDKGCDVVTVTAKLTKKTWVTDGVRYIGCPAQTCKGVTCAGSKSCGGSGLPLCARKNRGYVIVFEGHGGRSRSIRENMDGLVQIGG